MFEFTRFLSVWSENLSRHSWRWFSWCTFTAYWLWMRPPDLWPLTSSLRGLEETSVWTWSKPLLWSVFCHQSSRALICSKALGHIWRLSDKSCCSSSLSFLGKMASNFYRVRTWEVQQASEQTACKESALDNLIQTRNSSAGLMNSAFMFPC